MNDSSKILSVAGIMTLLEVGRFETAAGLAGEGWSDLNALIEYRMKKSRAERAYDELSNGMAEVLRGWDAYYRAQYRDAAAHFSAALASESPWIRAWASIGTAKAATDTGFLQSAREWCVLALALARRYEFAEHRSAAAGALGEVLLRGSCHREALTAFELDLALLPPGAYYRGRILCYRAHAYSRLGPECRHAAELAYRLAIHTPAERTDAYALAGMCLMAAEYGDTALFDDSIQRLESLSQPDLSPAHAWGKVGKARMALLGGSDGDLGTMCGEAYRFFPPEYHFERIWTRKWADSLGVHIPPELTSKPAQVDPRFSPGIPCAKDHTDWGAVTAFDRDEAEVKLPDTGLAAYNWGEDTETLWKERRRFMP